MGPQTEFLETIITCKGNYYSPDFVSQFNSFKCRLQKLVVPDNDKDLHIEKIEPWNSIRVTLKLPIEAANKLKQLAEQQNYLLRDMGVLAVQINKQQISLSIDRLQSRPRVPSNASISMLPNVPASSLFSSSSSSLALTCPFISASTMSSIPSSSLSVSPILNTSLSIPTSHIPLTSSLQTSSFFLALPTSSNSISSLPILTSFSSLSSTASPSTSLKFHQCTTKGYSSPQTTHSFMHSNILKHNYQPIKDSFINLNTHLKSSISTTQFQNTSLNHLSSKVTFSSNTNISLTAVENSTTNPNQNFASSSPLLVNLLRSPGSRNNNPQLQVLDFPDSTNDFSLHLKRKKNQSKKSKRLKGSFDVAGAFNHNLYLPNKSSSAMFSTLNSERIGSFKSEQKEFQELFNDHQDLERNNNATSPFSTNSSKLTHTLSNVHTTIPFLNHSTSHLSLNNNKLLKNYPSNLHLSSLPTSNVSKNDLTQKNNHNSIYQFTPQPNSSTIENLSSSSLSNLALNPHHQSSKHNFSNSASFINRTNLTLPSDHSSNSYNELNTNFNATNNKSNFEQHQYLQSNLKTLNTPTRNSNNNNISDKEILSKHHNFNNSAFEMKMSGFIGPNGQINVSGGGTSQKSAFIKSIHETVEGSLDITKKSSYSRNASPSEWNSTSKTSTESLLSSITNNSSSYSLDTMHNQVLNRNSVNKAGYKHNILQKDGIYKNATNKNEIHENITKNMSINVDVEPKGIIRDKVCIDTIKRETCQQFVPYSSKQSDSGSSTPTSNLKSSSQSYPTNNSTLDDYISNNSSDNNNKDKINNNNDINSKFENKSNPSSEENKSSHSNSADMNLQFDLSDPFSNFLKLPKRPLKNIEESHLPFKSKTNLTVAQLLEQVEIAKNSIPSKNFLSITSQSTEECGLTKCFSESSPSPNNYNRLVSSGPHVTQIKTTLLHEGKLEPLPMPITSPGYPHNLTESVQKAMAVVDFHNSPPTSPHSQPSNNISSSFKINVCPLNETKKSESHRPMSCNDLKSITAQDGDKYEGMKMYSEGELHEIMQRGSDHNTTASTNSNNSTLSAVEPDMNFCLNAEDENHLDSLISLKDYDDIEKLAEALASNINDGNLDDVMLMNEDFFNDEQLHHTGLKANIKIASKPSHKLNNDLIPKENGPSSSFLKAFDDRSSNDCEERQITFKNGNHVSNTDTEIEAKKELNNKKDEEAGEKKIRKRGGKKEPTVSESFNGPNNTRMSTRSSNKSKPCFPSSIQSSVTDATVISSSPEVSKESISYPSTSTPRRSTRTIKKTEIALESSATKASERHRKLMKEQAVKEANQEGKNKAPIVPLQVRTDGKSSKSKCINNKKISNKSVDDIDVLSGKRGEKKEDDNVSEANSDSTNPPETSTPSKKQKL